MAQTDYDVIVGGTKAKVVRSQEGGYRRRTLRREVEQQLLSQAENPTMVSRPDQRQLYQSSWAGGSRWWKPLLGPQEADSYFQAKGFDLWSEPGKVVPDNLVTDTADSNINANARLVSWKGKIYTIGTTQIDGTGYDVYEWDASSDGFVRTTGVNTAAATAPFGLAPGSTSNIHVLNNGGTTVFDPVGGSQSTRITGMTVTTGAAIFLHRNEIIIYDGAKVYKDNSGSAELIASDGEAREYLQNLPTGDILNQAGLNLAVNSPSGIHYVKNIKHRGVLTPFVFRLNKDAAGNWIVNPIATLPPGHAAIDITEHLGSILITATPNIAGLLANSSDNYVESVLFAVSPQGVNVIGSFLGNRDELDETPYKFLQAKGSLVYIGGQKRLWVYDAARGGLHSAFEWGTVGSTNAYNSMAQVLDSSGDHINLFITAGRIATQKLTQFDDPNTVTDFGDNEDQFVLTSNYFDGGLPFEEKELTRVEVMHEKLDAGDGTNANQEWTLQISADDGPFTDALVNSDSESTYASADLSGTTGRRFQYRLIYQTKNALRKALRALKVAFTTGEMITEWDLTLDGDELLNVDNELQDEQAFYDALVTLAGTSAITTLVDNMQEQAQETDDGTTINVKVQAVEINKQKPGESIIRVVLREAA